MQRATLWVYLFFLVGLVSTGCKSADRIMFRTPSSRLSSQLPPMEVAVENGPLALTEGALPEDPARVFQQEVSQNLIETVDSARFGYVKLIVTKAAVKRTGRFFQGLQMMTLMLPSLLGVPMEYYRTEVRANMQILNAQGDTLSTYTGSGRSKVRVAMYHGYSQAKAPRLSDVQALRLALDQIRPQLASDVDTLRQQLLANGPIKPEEPETEAAPASEAEAAPALETEAATATEAQPAEEAAIATETQPTLKVEAKAAEE